MGWASQWWFLLPALILPFGTAAIALDRVDRGEFWFGGDGGRLVIALVGLAHVLLWIGAARYAQRARRGDFLVPSGDGAEDLDPVLADAYRHAAERSFAIGEIQFEKKRLLERGRPAEAFERTVAAKRAEAWGMALALSTHLSLNLHVLLGSAEHHDWGLRNHAPLVNVLILAVTAAHGALVVWTHVDYQRCSAQLDLLRHTASSHVGSSRTSIRV
jgi:hypothetical protein